MTITSMSDVLTRTLENPQFGACMVWSTIRISLLLVTHCSHFLYRDDMSNSRYIVHIDSYIFRMRPLHYWLCGILEQFHRVGAIAKKFEQGSWNPHIWVHFQANIVATLVRWYTSLIRYASHFHSTLPSRLKSSRSALTKGIPQLQKMFTRCRTWMKRLAFGPRNDRIYQSRVYYPCSSSDYVGPTYQDV